MKYGISLLVLSLVVLSGAAGCRRAEGPAAGKAFNDFSENRTVYIMERNLSDVLAIDKQRHAKMPNGALKVDTVLRNRLEKPIWIEASTEFRDADQFSIDDTTPWKVFVLQPLESKTYTSMSTRTNAETFTVHIRSAKK